MLTPCGAARAVNRAAAALSAAAVVAIYKLITPEDP